MLVGIIKEKYSNSNLLCITLRLEIVCGTVTIFHWSITTHMKVQGRDLDNIHLFCSRTVIEVWTRQGVLTLLRIWANSCSSFTQGLNRRSTRFATWCLTSWNPICGRRRRRITKTRIRWVWTCLSTDDYFSFKVYLLLFWSNNINDAPEGVDSEDNEGAYSFFQNQKRVYCAVVEQIFC